MAVKWPDQHIAKYATPMRKLLAISRLIAFAFITIYYVSLVIICKPFNRRNPYYFLAIEKRWARLLVKTMGIKLKLEGEVPQEHGLLVGNHRSYIDVILVPPLKPATFVAKSEVRKWPIVGFGCTVIKVIFVDRSSPESRKKTRSDIRDGVLDGLSVLVYPEGTTSMSPHLNLLKPGMFYVAADAGIPVIPVALEYQRPEDAWIGDDTFLPHFLKTFSNWRTHVTIRFGSPISASDGGVLREQVTDWMQKNLHEMQGAYGHLLGEAAGVSTNRL